MADGEVLSLFVFINNYSTKKKKLVCQVYKLIKKKKKWVTLYWPRYFRVASVLYFFYKGKKDSQVDSLYQLYLPNKIKSI